VVRSIAAWAIMLLACAAIIAPVRAQSGGSGEGWTPFVPSSDTRIVYVSSSSGTDWTNSRTYRANDPEVGGDPFNPVGNVSAYRSLARAYQELRDGRPDWILLKRGDTWTTAIGDDQWRKSGRSSMERMLIATYGPNDARPTVSQFRTEYGPNDPEDAFDHVAILGIRFTGGLDRIIGGDDFLIEDCHFDECGVSIQGYGPVEGQRYLSNVAIRRSVLFGNYSTTGHAQNLFVKLTDGLLVEECVLDRGGWNPDVQGAEQTMFNHNAYIQYDTINVTFRGNISARASSHGAQLRRGGVCEDNLFLQNPINLLIGQASNEWPAEAATGIVRNNVMLDSRNIAGVPRGYGLWIEKADGVEVADNIIAHQQRGSVGVAMNVGTTYRNLFIHDNIVYDWVKPSDPSSGKCLQFNDDPRGLNRVRGNQFQQPRDGEMISHRVPFTAFSYANNTYFTSNDADDWFEPGGTYGAWRNQSGETGSQARRVSYPSPERTIETYMASLGRTPTLEAFLAQARLQSRRNWRSEFTAAAVNEYIRDGFIVGSWQQADVAGFDVPVGMHLDGGLADIEQSDGRHIVVQSTIDVGSMFPYIAELRVSVDSPIASPATIDITVESSMLNSIGTARIALRNWDSGEFDEFHAYAVSPFETSVQVRVPNPVAYVRATDGRIRVSVQHEASIGSNATGFRSKFDQVLVEVRD